MFHSFTIPIRMKQTVVGFLSNYEKLYYALSTGCLKKRYQFLHRTKEQLIIFSMILFLNRNDEKWPHTRQIKISGRKHILPPLGIAWKTKHKQFPRGN